MDTASRPVVFWCAAAAMSAAALTVALFALFGEFGAARHGGSPETDGPSAIATTGTAIATTRAEMVAHLADNPGDGRGWALLARLDFSDDRFGEAAQEYEKALAASPKVARDPDIWCEYADALGMARGGSLEGQPREFVARALAIDSHHPKALEMAGSAAYEQRDYAAAAGYWRQLLGQMHADSPSYRELAAALARVELQASAEGSEPRADTGNVRDSK